MSLPANIARQVAEANNAMAAMSANSEAQDTAVLNDPSELPAPTPAPAADSAPPPAPTPAPAPADDPNSETWAQRFRSLQGLISQRGNEWQQREQQMGEQIKTLQQALAGLQTAREQKPTEKPSADPKDVESFGADLVEMVQRYAERVFQTMSTQFGGKMAELEQRMSAFEQQVTGVSKKTDLTLEQQYYATLDTTVPQWRAVNTSQKWLEWLGEIDPVYGAPRQAALDLAHQALDARRVGVIFTAFLRQHPPVQKESLADHVSPPSAAAPSQVPTQSASKPVLSSAFVQRFFNDKARGAYTARPDEAARIEAEINRAAAENRIR